jgi:hypothetical protein
MEILKKTISKEYLPVVLYLDDIEKILSVLLEFGNNNLEIKTKDYGFNDIKEFEKQYLNQNIKYLDIKLSNPYITLSFDKTSSKVYFSSDDSTLSGAFFKIDKIISNAQRKPSFLYSYTYIIGIFIFLEILSNFNILDKIYEIPLILLFFIWYLWMAYTRLFNSSSIVVNKRSNVQKFFSKNRDFIIGLSIGIIILCLEHFEQIWHLIKNIFIKN